MESVENKLIYLKVCKHGNVNAGRHCVGKCSLVRAKSTSWADVFFPGSEFWKKILLPVFPVEAKEFRWLGYDVLAYVIFADVQAGNSDTGGRCNLRKRLAEERFRRTIGMISDRIRESVWGQVRLLIGGIQWSFVEGIGVGETESVFPEEMVYRFFDEAVRAHCKSAGVAEQLILIAPDTEEESVSEYLEEALLLAYRLYPEYNYMTILTDQPSLFQPVMQEAAEESGLYIRCMAKEKNVLFPDKKTAILDLDRELTPCYRHFPGDALYVTPWDSVEKKRRLQAKCPQIACFSMLNDLDTVLHNTV